MANKSISLHIKAVLAVTLFLVVTSVILGALLTQQSRLAMKSLIDSRILDVANTAAYMLDGDALRSITDDNKNSPEYDHVFEVLSSFEKNTDLEFVYAVRKEDDDTYIFVVDPATENASEYGDLVHITEALQSAGEGTASVDEVPYTDEYGHFYSAYSPVFDSSGKVAGIVAVDFDALWYEGQLDKNTLTIVVACVLFAISGAILSALLARQYNKHHRQEPG